MNKMAATLYARPWLMRALAVLFLLALLLVASAAGAHADDGTAPPNENQFNGVTDSHGVPADKYNVPPFDRGGMDNLIKMINAFYIDTFWSWGVTMLNGAMWFFQWLLSFQWVSMVTSPIMVFATTIQSLFGGLNFIPFALAIAGLVYGIQLAKGRYAHGALNLFISALVAVLLTGVLANPATAILGSNGLLHKSIDMGGQAAVAMATDGKNMDASGLAPSDVINATVNQKLTDIFLRDPSMYVSFGKKLTGDCEKIFDAKMKAVKTGDTGDNSVRDAVAKCDPDAKFFMQHPSGQLDLLGSVGLGILVFFLMAAAFAIILIFSVAVLTWRTLQLIPAGYLALLPGDERAGFWNVLLQVFAAIATVALSLVALVLYLRFVIEILTALDVLGRNKFVVLAALFLGGIIFLFLFRKKLHATAGKISAKMSSFMGAKGQAPRQPVTGAQVVRQTVNTVQQARMLGAMNKQAKATTGGPGATPVKGGPSSPSKGGAATAEAGTTATKGGSAAAQGGAGATKSASALGGAKLQTALGLAAKIPYVGVAARGVQVAAVVIPKAQQFAKNTVSAHSAPARRSARNEQLRTQLNRHEEKVKASKEKIHTKLDAVDARRDKTPRRSAQQDVLDRKETQLRSKLLQTSPYTKADAIRAKLAPGEKAETQFNQQKASAKEAEQQRLARLEERQKVRRENRGHVDPVKGF
ncbi:hypothetical protein [Arthrobacter cryoconiti]|uniref:Integral membrane protein n=1 Tax=Arthrobacter cryoconiti TaxID=748907 RepID=A0ABV8R4R9_9MICC|nr:hypothetical protein [Arthrobacter cryoconiti]MCC9069339.1 hypothetical protein [Arthrobacter cryoconiti]